MKKLNLTKDEIKKLAVSAIAFVVLLYVYFGFFLGPLRRSQATMVASIKIAQAAPMIPYLLLVLVLIIRPKGLLGTRES